MVPAISKTNIFVDLFSPTTFLFTGSMPPESDVQVEEIKRLLERELKKRKGRKLNRDVMWLMKLEAQTTKDSKAQLS